MTFVKPALLAVPHTTGSVVTFPDWLDIVRQSESWFDTNFPPSATLLGKPLRLKPRDAIELSLGTPARQLTANGTVWHILSFEEEEKKAQRGRRSQQRYRNDGESARLPKVDRFAHLPCVKALLDSLERGCSDIHVWRDGRTPRVVLVTSPDDSFMAVLIDNKSEFLLTTCYPVRAGHHRKTVQASRSRGSKFP